MNDPIAPVPASGVVDAILRWRYMVIAVVSVIAAVLAGGRGDWDFFVLIGRQMFEQYGLEIFVVRPNAQLGPISLIGTRLLAITPWDGFGLFVVVCNGLAIVSVRNLELAAVEAQGPRIDRRRLQAVTLLGGSIVAVWWAQLGSAGHLDDTLVLAVVAFAILELARGRRLPAAALLGMTLAIKPWAVIFLPLTLAGSKRTGERRRAVLIALVVGVLLWAPFVLTYPKTISAIKPVVNVAPDSVLHLFGVTTANLPASMRVYQLLTAMIVVALAVRRRHLAGAALAGIAVRLATDPATWTYYTPGMVCFALAWDLAAGRRRVPVATIAVSLLLLPPSVVPWADARGTMRLVACVGAVVWVLSRDGELSAPSRSAGRSHPTPDRWATG